MADSTSVELRGLPISRFDLSMNFTDIQWGFAEIKEAKDSEIEKFEREFADYLGVKQAIYTASVRAALYIILQSLNLAPRSRVLIPAWTHHSIPAMIIAAGLQPCLVDIRKRTWTMGPELISEDDWEGVSVIIITHMYGCPAPAEELAAEARSRNIVVIEDCAQGFGAEINGRKAGSIGDAAVFSFAMTKNFTTMGGGMAVFQNQRLADKCTELMKDAKITPSSSMYPALIKAAAMWAGTTKLGFLAGPYPFLAIGWMFLGKDMLHKGFIEEVSTSKPDYCRKPSPLQASMGRRLLKWSSEQNEYRTNNGLKLIKLFEEENIPNLTFSAAPDYGKSVFMSFIINYESSEKLARQLFHRGIDTSPGYLAPIHQQPIFSESVRYFGTLPNSNFLARTQLHIPVYPSLNEKDLKRIVVKCKESIEYIEHYHASETVYRSMPSNTQVKTLTDPSKTQVPQSSPKEEQPKKQLNIPEHSISKTEPLAVPKSEPSGTVDAISSMPPVKVQPRLSINSEPSSAVKTPLRPQLGIPRASAGQPAGRPSLSIGGASAPKPAEAPAPRLSRLSMRPSENSSDKK